MSFFRRIRLFIECWQLAGFTGLIACTKFTLGLLQLSDIPLKCSVSPEGDFYV